MYDREETKRRGYTDPKSRVYFDGRERLHGKDWTKRKREVWDRGGGRCERIVNYVGSMDIPVRCKSEMHDPHHEITRGKKRDDRIENLIGLCRLHHELAHEKRNPRWGTASQLRNKRLLGMA